MFSKGADVDALRDSAGRLASFGREVDVVRARGQRAVSVMQSAWQGPDLQHLLERWRRVEHDLQRISADLDRLARRLHDNADLQHRSSGFSGLSGSSGSALSPAGVSGSRHPAGHVSGPVAHPVAPTDTPSGRRVSGAHPVVVPGVPQPLRAVGLAQWIGGAVSGPAGHPAVDPTHAPVRSAAVVATAAHQLGRPTR
ncbi:hypothetical protein GCM10009868_19720 [Terrabacter aerolatus]|uniref:WXG100 family type VII secretion target n=1 Tax=Terrabacter aerolatus TaxID=422442 RepID=A0A512D052_9MICO|nr:hypothetical protein [Terrabacter aerolatus]GEO29844.1 hypothetical protein TAE01_16540 [Terrabacter aerolatus]